jgi:hypothetical protein
MKKIGNKSIILTGIPDIIIPARYVPEFFRVVMIGTQELRGWDKTDWTFKEKQAFKLAEKLVKKYA